MQHAVALHDNASLRDIEAAARAASGDSGALMQLAGEAGWRHLLASWPQAQRILVVCGAGNNGGDGYALATQALLSGRAVAVVRLAAPASDEARQACAQFIAAGGTCSDFDGTLPGVDVLVDALFGIGLRHAPDAASARLIDAINASGCIVFSLDVPSGVDADSGNVPGKAVRADSTLQFIAAHRGLATGAALDHRGAADVADLGVQLDAFPPSAYALPAASLQHWLKPRALDTHKGDFGHVLCIGGDSGHGGAIILCAEAALRAGAGLVSVATQATTVSALLARRPEAMVAAVEDADALHGMAAAASVLAIGPGLGTQAWGSALLDAALSSGKPLVMDADALNLLAASPRQLAAGTILTPHPGEAGRLLGIDVAAVQADRFSAASALVERHHCVIVLKGAGTIIAAPGQAPCVIAAGNPGMAVGGMGDLLTGVIAALRAQGLDAFDAACCGALLHAVAGDVAAASGGQRGLLPSDLLCCLRDVSNPQRGVS
ncbi:NAD(P)H-hydrate dehydratase [Cognatiluteimonas profundi]|uniref:NAD(P)H-hydrate dehydratase n=1 Tax=Cognatiluteimonas profundi TaxID=2594501 RepID=UPI00131AD6D2|nr:NAD(P)H-hydrate dehydratase [Lysobacter profundi]